LFIEKFLQTVSNIRAIRSMSFERVFTEQYDESLQVALKTGIRGSMVAGSNYGVANALVYLAQGLINLVVFSVSIAAQILAFGE
jgi:ATP-binding cassette, subfamily B (MDR/TAP), member 1